MRHKSNYNAREDLSTPVRPMTLVKSTTRHIHIFTAEVQNNELVPSENVMTLDVDPDNELNWNDDALQKVYRKFDDLVESYNGQDLTEYNLRKIGSDLEHFVRSLLNKGEISYNLNSRVLNYSLGMPRLNVDAQSDGSE
jgi:NAD(P)H-quinone oxidoreductase subunit M